MLRIGRYLSVMIMVFGLIRIVIGAVFIYQSFAQNHFLVNAMKQEKITLGLTPEQVQAGQIVDNEQSALNAANTIRGHRHSIAPTYNGLLGGKQFDPTNPTEITYMQALNLENYLYLAVLTFGVITIAEGAGVFMIITGAVGIFTGLIFFYIINRLKTLKNNAA